MYICKIDIISDLTFFKKNSNITLPFSCAFFSACQIYKALWRKWFSISCRASLPITILTVQMHTYLKTDLCTFSKNVYAVFPIGVDTNTNIMGLPKTILKCLNCLFSHDGCTWWLFAPFLPCYVLNLHCGSVTQIFFNTLLNLIQCYKSNINSRLSRERQEQSLK